MILSIHQPSFFPYLGFFDKVQRSDAFVFLDNVQFEKNNFQNRNKIFIGSPKDKNKRVDWLTLPVSFKHFQGIKEIPISGAPDIFEKHYKILEQSYKNTSGWKMLARDFRKLYQGSSENVCFLSDFNRITTTILMELLGIKVPCFSASSLVGFIEDPNLRLIQLCKILNADTYLAGSGGRNYMDLSLFEKNGIKVIFQDWHPFPYYQIHSPDTFVPCLSALDLVFNHAQKSQELFKRSIENV